MREPVHRIAWRWWFFLRCLPKWADDLNRRATVEQMLFDMAAGKESLPGREDCRQIALYLGVRGRKKPSIAGVGGTDEN